MSKELDLKKVAWNRVYVNKSPLLKLMNQLLLKYSIPRCCHIIQQYLKPGSSLLDAGCGPAMNTIYLSKLVDIDAWGIDLSEIALQEASQISKDQGININFKKGDILNMPFCDRNFDFVWNVGVLEHFHQPVEVINEMARVGNNVLIIVPGMSKFRGVLQKLKLKLNLAADDLFILYTKDDLVDLMNQCKNLKVLAAGSFKTLGILSYAWVYGTRV